MPYTEMYLNEVETITKNLNALSINFAVEQLREIRKDDGRVFFMGLGHSAGVCTQAVSDLRKSAGIKAFTLLDNMAEFTAWLEADDPNAVFSNWLRTEKLGHKDAIFVLSLGGRADQENKKIVRALEYAKSVHAMIFSIVAGEDSYAIALADSFIVIPCPKEETLVPHTEAFQLLLLRLIASHPGLQISKMKWENLAEQT